MKNYIFYKHKNQLPFWILLVAFCLSCNKLVEVPAPPNSINGDNVFKQDNTAAAVINGIFLRIASGTIEDGRELSCFASVYPALLADELTLLPDFETLRYDYYYKNALTSSDEFVRGHWLSTYGTVIRSANDAIEHLEVAGELNPNLRNQLLGQAYFIRAFGNFYLATTYGNIPLVLNTDYKKNMLLTNTAELDVYAQVIADLKIAKELVGVSYTASDGRSPSSSRITPNKAAVSALLARVYLYHRDFALAAQEASSVIDQSSLYRLENLDKVFLANSQETIWQLQPTEVGLNTEDGKVLITPELGPDSEHPFVINSDLLKAFERNDRRKAEWIGIRKIGAEEYNYPNKYKVSALSTDIVEYKVVFRLAELYLIRAEARAESGDSNGAIDDINLIRNRAGLGDTPAVSKDQILEAITKERYTELFTEWGDRWFNLRRTGQIDRVMGTASSKKGSTWRPFQKLMPIPADEVRIGVNLKQNEGY